MTHANDAVEAGDAGSASMEQVNDSFAPSRDAATDAVKDVVETAVPAHDQSVRVGSIQSDSLKGDAPERWDLREPPGVVRFSDPTPGPPPVSVVTGPEDALRPARMPTPPRRNLPVGLPRRSSARRRRSRPCNTLTPPRGHSSFVG